MARSETSSFRPDWIASRTSSSHTNSRGFWFASDVDLGRTLSTLEIDPVVSG
jgi:hypothetical protein